MGIEQGCGVDESAALAQAETIRQLVNAVDSHAASLSALDRQANSSTSRVDWRLRELQQSVHDLQERMGLQDATNASMQDYLRSWGWSTQ